MPETARAGGWENLPKGRVRLRTAADIPVSPGLPKPNILSELQSLGIPRILNFLKPKAPALTFLSERGRAASMLMALCHGKCRGSLERSRVLEAPPVPPGPPAIRLLSPSEESFSGVAGAMHAARHPDALIRRRGMRERTTSPSEVVKS